MTQNPPTPDPVPAQNATPAQSPTPDPTGRPDQTERVILETAGAELEIGRPCDVIVVDDGTGVLTREALDQVLDHADSRVFSWNASHHGTRALADAFPADVEAGRLCLSGGEGLAEFLGGADAHLVLMRLPKSLAALESRAAALAGAAGARREDLTIIAGGRVKHMSRTQNEVLARYFDEVHASRGLGKSRCLVAKTVRGSVADGGEFPAAMQEVRLSVREQEQDVGLRAVGGVFSGAQVDAGSRLLLRALDEAVVGGHVAEPATVLDLGSGNGLLTAYAAAAFPDSAVIASDDDLDAVVSTRETLAAVGAEAAEVTWDTSASRVPDGSVDLVLLNPPFHDGPAVDPALVQELLDATARVLRPGGALWFVHNSHLRYRPEVERRVGPVQQHARDRRFTVLEATRR